MSKSEFLVNLSSFVCLILFIHIVRGQPGSPKGVDKHVDLGSQSPLPMTGLQPDPSQSAAEISSIADTHAQLLAEAHANPQLLSTPTAIQSTSGAPAATAEYDPLLDVASEESFQKAFIMSVMENVRAIETRYKPNQNNLLERDEEWTLELARIRNGMRSHPGPISPRIQATINAFLEEKPIRGEIFKLMIRLETLIMAQVDKILEIEKKVPERQLGSLKNNKFYINRLVDLITLEETGQNVLPRRYFHFIKDERRIALVEAKLLERGNI